LRVCRHQSIRAAERALRAVHETARPYQHYEVLRACERGWWRCAWRNPLAVMWAWFTARRPFRTYVVEDDVGKVLCVAPLQREGRSWKVVDGDFVPLNYVDLLYAERSSSELESAFACLRARLHADGIAAVRVGALAEDSVTNVLIVNCPHREIGNRTSVAIHFPGGWKDFRRNLGANARSNLNKAHGRLRRAGRSCTFECYSNGALGEALSSPRGRRSLKDCMRFYWRRLGHRYSHRGWSAWMYFNHCSHTTLAVVSPDAFLGVLRIDGEAAAFMQGYVDRRHGAVCLPRIAMNDQWREFSPGRLLVDECVKWLETNSELRTLDLTCGEERYKYDLGGEGYSTHDIEFSTGGA